MCSPGVSRWPASPVTLLSDTRSLPGCSLTPTSVPAVTSLTPTSVPLSLLSRRHPSRGHFTHADRPDIPPATPLTPTYQTTCHAGFRCPRGRSELSLVADVAREAGGAFAVIFACHQQPGIDTAEFTETRCQPIEAHSERAHDPMACIRFHVFCPSRKTFRLSNVCSSVGCHRPESDTWKWRVTSTAVFCEIYEYQDSSTIFNMQFSFMLKFHCIFMR